MAKLALKGGNPIRSKPFTAWPIYGKEEEEALLNVLHSRKWWMYAYGSAELVSGEAAGDRSKVELFEEAFAAMHRARYAIAVTSGSTALDICIRACGISPGDEVITTPYTFIATSTCILNHYALPVYVDIDRETYNIDVKKIESAITERTKAILPVHFAGEMGDMEAICGIARKYGLKVIEDAAQAQGVSLEDDRFAGTWGDMGIFSFQESKVITVGEGGLILTNDEQLASLAWSLRHYGREKSGLWYEHFRLGWNARMTEFQGACLLAQLGRLEEQNKTRMKNVSYFYKCLEDIPGLVPCRLHPKATRHSHYLVMLRYDARCWQNVHRNSVVEALAAEGIPASTGYTFPNYANPLFDQLDFKSPTSSFMRGRKTKVDFNRYSELCPNAERACRDEAVWLPHNLFLGSKEDVDDIINAILKVRDNLHEMRE